MKTIKERAKAIIFEHESDIATAFSRAFALVQELANAPEPEPVGEAVDFNGWRIVRWKGKESSFPLGTKVYTAPPTPSVPDEQLQAAFDRGLKAGNEQAIAQQIEIHKLHDLLATQQQEQPADLVRDAERYRWLRNALSTKTKAGKSHHFCSIQRGKPEELDEAIDAAIAAEKGGA